MKQGFTITRTLATHDEFEAMFAASVDMITLHELDGTVRLASEACRAILGFEPAELIGRMPAETFVYAEDVPLLTAAIERLRKGLETIDFTFRARTETGSPQWLETRISTVRDGNGSATGFVAVSRVVTDRLEAERLLQTQLERYRQIADAVPGMTVWIVDRAMRCRFAAGAGFPSLGIDPASCFDRPLGEILSADRLAAVRPHLEEAFAGRTSTEDDQSVPNRNFWLRYVPVAETSGAVEEVLVVGMEVTDREQTHEALRRSEASFSTRSTIRRSAWRSLPRTVRCCA